MYQSTEPNVKYPITQIQVLSPSSVVQTIVLVTNQRLVILKDLPLTTWLYVDSWAPSQLLWDNSSPSSWFGPPPNT